MLTINYLLRFLQETSKTDRSIKMHIWCTLPSNSTYGTFKLFIFAIRNQNVLKTEKRKEQFTSALGMCFQTPLPSKHVYKNGAKDTPVIHQVTLFSTAAVNIYPP